MLVAAPKLSNIKTHNKALVWMQTTLCFVCTAQLQHYTV
jgi:hypothetical protein